MLEHAMKKIVELQDENVSLNEDFLNMTNSEGYWHKKSVALDKQYAELSAHFRGLLIFTLMVWMGLVYVIWLNI